ncbi:MAG: diguanylate cyclase [Gallionella sp.]|nr:diguanylate cyclase [Gallionella sp.]
MSAMMNSRTGWWTAVLLCCCWALPAQALERVALQLKWTHAFQFAGYYAALEQGYYRDAGLDVNIVEADPATDPVSEVLAGRSQYGVGTSSLLLARAAGKPVVALAVVFQQSPYAIYAAPHIGHLEDLVGKRLMLESQSDELLAYLKKEGIPLDRIRQIPHSFDADGLMQGKADAISGYISNEPYFFQQAQYPYRTFSPRSAGIDFYGDNLFTSAQELDAHPQRVRAFRAASLRGWQYAKQHRDEVIELIRKKYAPNLSYDYLRFESDQMLPLLQPNLIEIGYMNPGRWRDIALTYADLGLMPADFSFDGFLYDATEQDMGWFYRALGVALLLVAGIGGVALYIMRTNRRLKSSITALETTQQALAKSEKHYRVLVETMRDVVWVLDSETLYFRYVSPSVERLRGYTPEEVMCESLDAALTPEYATLLKQQIKLNKEEFLSGREPDKVYIEEIQQPRKDGTLVWTEAIAKYYRNEESGRIEVHGVTRDISERRAAQEKIRHMALHDLLTGLPNRMLLNDRLQQALASVRRDGGMVGLMFLDLDKFKQVNDTLGHDVGDLLLVQVAARMLDCVRGSDTVARIGGDEFIVLLRTVDGIADAVMVGEKIREALHRPFELAGRQLAISSSIGIALYPEHGADGVELSKNADIAMYHAKAHGRDRVQPFRAEMSGENAL